jgi:hypothetical protein
LLGAAALSIFVNETHCTIGERWFRQLRPLLF